MSSLASDAERYLRQAIAAHPAEPVDEPCPFCAEVGLTARIPCGPRIAALATLRSYEARRAAR